MGRWPSFTSYFPVPLCELGHKDTLLPIDGPSCQASTLARRVPTRPFPSFFAAFTVLPRTLPDHQSASGSCLTLVLPGTGSSGLMNSLAQGSNFEGQKEPCYQKVLWALFAVAWEVAAAVGRSYLLLWRVHFQYSSNSGSKCRQCPRQTDLEDMEKQGLAYTF